ncbi:MAG TPA: phosphatase PAP2 family protein [Pilimelia sp.]|nr:phosphatase PAP2 family protein [Pilimelia sp.]
MTQARLVTRRQLEHFAGRSLTGLLIIAGAGAGFGLLLILVRGAWGPLYRADHGVAQWLNDTVAPHGPIVTVLQAVTDVGGRPIMMWLVAAVLIGLLIRRQLRLAIYLVVTGVGALVLDPSLKLLVGRLRPVVEDPVASAPGNSFPSGHALGSMVVYGAIVLIFLPVLAPRFRKVLIGLAAAAVLLVGVTRVALGVHFVSDVLAGWLLGAAWLGVTAYAFQLWRRETGQPMADPLHEGLEPEAADDISPAPREKHLLPHPRAGTAEILTGWVLIFGVLFVVGLLVSRVAEGTVVRDVDLAVVRWFESIRTPTLDDVSWWWSKAGDTHAVLLVCLVFCPLMVAVTRRWRPVLFLALAMVGELTLFLATSGAVDRPRPPVELLDGKLPTSAFPSGHIAATMCLWVAIAVLVLPRTDRWWRWLAVAAAVIMPIGVAVSRMYRGMHHPTDFLGATLLTAMWISLLYWVVRPNADLAEERAGARVPRGRTERPLPTAAAPGKAAPDQAAATPDRAAAGKAAEQTQPVR